MLAWMAWFVGCGHQERTAATAPGPERRRILEFWQQFNAATEARVARDCARAVALYEGALRLNPGHQDSLYYLGQCRRDLGEPEAARGAFRRLVELNPVSARGHLALGALLASPDPREELDLVEAERHLRRAHDINAEETGSMVRLGEVLLVTGRHHEARRWFESALRTNPRSLEAALLMAYAAWEEGNPDRAGLVRQLQAAAKREAPVKGVLGEGDRRGPRHGHAPPLANPVGRLLFEEPVLALRSHAENGEPLSQRHVLEALRSVRRLCRQYELKAGS
jgi:tetratricopeptide (TPR) repeat protein